MVSIQGDMHEHYPGENRRLVTDKPVEFEEQPVEVGDFGRITHHFRGIYKIYLKGIMQNRKMSTCSNPVTREIFGHNNNQLRS